MTTVLSAHCVFAADNIKQETAYERLEKMLPVYEEAVKEPWPTLNINYGLKKGVQDPSVTLLRERLCKTNDLVCSPHERNSMFFDQKLEDAVSSFQERHNLNPDGIVGVSTRAALNVSPQERLQQIHINLSRLSYLASHAESKYVWVNVPDYRLRLVDNHQAIVVFPVIVGKPSRKTPEIDSKIMRITVNPCWCVPPTILRQDLIPKASAYPNYLKEHCIRVFSVTNPKNEIPLQKINWSSVKKNPSSYIFRQDPGPHNALGQIKFEFYNPHSIYLHDTPTKGLFEQEKRLLSSGCIRIKEPLVFLSHLVEWDESLKGQEQKLESALQSGRTTTFSLGRPIPIHITYITAWVDGLGKLHFWDDVYNHDEELIIRESNQQRDLPQPV